MLYSASTVPSSLWESGQVSFGHQCRTEKEELHAVTAVLDVLAVVQLVWSDDGLTIRTESHQLCKETHQLAVEASLYNEYRLSILSE